MSVNRKKRLAIVILQAGVDIHKRGISFGVKTGSNKLYQTLFLRNVLAKGMVKFIDF
ncbi:MAG: hypothetical protein ACI9T7_000067 [Oleiphilaceae bacterium]|jgi:hypothetical protein